MRPIKTEAKIDEKGLVIVPEGYRFVPEIKRVRKGKEETIRAHCRLIRPVKRRLSMKRRAELLFERQCRGETGPFIPYEKTFNQEEFYSIIKVHVIEQVRREINRVLGEIIKSGNPDLEHP